MLVQIDTFSMKENLSEKNQEIFQPDFQFPASMENLEIEKAIETD